mmetsp:Transcript_3614/g.479  ORF Transcript_3614/g.479 Transcript_3614/m.479 type:complete len:82 (+) Transcript_3614:871-1116(+)
MHKTTLTKCLCGSWNCREYLGIVEYNNKKCIICKEYVGSKKLINCHQCKLAYHMKCIKPVEKQPDNNWYCNRCLKISRKVD